MQSSLPSIPIFGDIMEGLTKFMSVLFTPYSVPSQKSLSVAKYNIENYYILVGLQEDYDAFLQGLDYLLPRFCKGLVQYYNNRGNVQSCKDLANH